MIIESHYDMNNFTNIVITPMSFLCGTFFSLDGIPEALKMACECDAADAYHTRLIRQLAFGGGVNWASMAVSVLFVIVRNGPARCGNATWPEFRPQQRIFCRWQGEDRKITGRRWSRGQSE